MQPGLLHYVFQVVTLLTCICLTCAGAGGDIGESGPEFTFPPSSGTTFSDGNFIILDDDVYEYDKLIMADFEFINKSNDTIYNFIKEQPDVTYIVVKDDDGK